MRVAVTCRGASPDYDIDECFGRAYWLLVFDVVNRQWTAIDNGTTRNVRHNAGVLACQNLVEQKVDLLLTGQIGPKALRMLQAAGIAVHVGVAGSAREAVRSWQQHRSAIPPTANATGNPNCLVGKVVEGKYPPIHAHPYAMPKRTSDY